MLHLEPAVTAAAVAVAAIAISMCLGLIDVLVVFKLVVLVLMMMCGPVWSLESHEQACEPFLETGNR